MVLLSLGLYFLNIRLVVPVQMEQVADTELCIIFGNLLENAMEACKRIDGGTRFLHLYSRLEHGVLTISFDGQLWQTDGNNPSRNQNDWGVGLSSIQTVARKYGGDARFEPDGTVFRSSVYLTVQEM